MPEFCLTQEVWGLVRREYPDQTWSGIARMLDRDESAIRKSRKRKHMSLLNADRILSELDLTQGFYNGEIQVFNLPLGGGNPKEMTKYEKLRLENIQLKREIKRLRGYRG